MEGLLIAQVALVATVAVAGWLVERHTGLIPNTLTVPALLVNVTVALVAGRGFDALFAAALAIVVGVIAIRKASLGGGMIKLSAALAAGVGALGTVIALPIAGAILFVQARRAIAAAEALPSAPDSLEIASGPATGVAFTLAMGGVLALRLLPFAQ